MINNVLSIIPGNTPGTIDFFDLPNSMQEDLDFVLRRCREMIDLFLGQDREARVVRDVLRRAPLQDSRHPSDIHPLQLGERDAPPPGERSPNFRIEPSPFSEIQVILQKTPAESSRRCPGEFCTHEPHVDRLLPHGTMTPDTLQHRRGTEQNIDG